MSGFTHRQFVDELVREFPGLRDDVSDEIWSGLLHLETACFARYTQAVIDEENANELRRCFAFATRVFQDCAPDVKNAMYVSYLVNLNFEDGKSRRAWAIDQMPCALKAAWVEINQYLDDLFSKGEARRSGKTE
jgi:hypothetical protein